MARGGMPGPDAHANQRALDNYAARQERREEKAEKKAGKKPDSEPDVHTMNDTAHAYYQQLGEHGKG